MPQLYKYSAVQGTSSVTSYATLYGSNGTGVIGAVVSSICVANTTTSSATFRIAINSTNGTPSLSDSAIIAWDSTVAPNDTVFITVGASMDANKYIRVSSSVNTIGFTAFISEIT